MHRRNNADLQCQESKTTPKHNTYFKDQRAIGIAIFHGGHHIHAVELDEEKHHAANRLVRLSGARRARARASGNTQTKSNKKDQIKLIAIEAPTKNQKRPTNRRAELRLFEHVEFERLNIVKLNVVAKQPRNQGVATSIKHIQC